MNEVGLLLLSILRQAWGALTVALAAIALLAMLAQVLKAASAGALGASYWVWEAASACAGVLILVLFGFLGVPAIVEAVASVIPSENPSYGFESVAELTRISGMLIGALAALRMLRAILVSAALTAAGSGGGISRALIEAGEAVFGMLVASLAFPLIVHFLL